MTVTDTEPTVRVSAHANCDHPKTKVARAACRRARRADWIAIVRGDERVTKGITVRVHTSDDMLEGELLGWGAKRIVLRVEGDRVNVNADDALKIEIPNA